MTVQDEKPAVNALAADYERRALGHGRAVAHRVQTIAYGAQPHQLIDLFVPSNISDGPLPVMLFFHGGGFTHGHRRWNHFMAPLFDRVPMLFASVGYRLLNEGYEGPVQLDDVATALGWAHRMIADHGGDPTRLFVGGHSAGAALAAAICLRPDLLADAAVPLHVVKGALCLSPSFNRYAITGTPGANYLLPDGPLPVAPDAPLGLVDAAHAPMLIGWGGAERQRERVERSAMAMIGALRDRNVPVDWMFLDGASHFDTHLALADVDHDWPRTILHWLQRLG